MAKKERELCVSVRAARAWREDGETVLCIFFHAAAPGRFDFPLLFFPPAAPRPARLPLVDQKNDPPAGFEPAALALL